MSFENPEPTVKGISPSLVGLVIGVSAALPLYLWLGNVQTSVASFVIAGYTAWLWAYSHNEAVMNGLLRAELRRLEVNRLDRRAARLVLDPGFWWTTIFGISVVGGSVWYAGLQDYVLLTAVCGFWSIIAVCLSFGLTIVHPVTQCRRCGYDLTGQLAESTETSIVRCPECGAKWNRSQLGRSPMMLHMPHHIA